MRLVGFAALVLVAFALLRHLPVVGNHFLSLWLAVILVSVGVSRLGARARVHRRARGEIAALAQVDSAHNCGKLGAMHLALGRARTALPHLREAWAREPETLEWGYRLGCAQLSTGALDEAVATLREVTATDEAYAYGGAQMRLAEALAARARRRESSAGAAGNAEALAALSRYDENHGESPESAYRRARVLRALGRRDEARLAFRRVGELARRSARYQRRAATGWALRAGLARLL